LGLAQIRHPGELADSLHDFLSENRFAIEEIRSTITRLEWDMIRKISGKQFASKFLLEARLRQSGFSRHNRTLVTVSSGRHNLATTVPLKVKRLRMNPSLTRPIPTPRRMWKELVRLTPEHRRAPRR
jgi:hypothetical protein